MQKLSHAQFTDSLRAAGLQSGDTLHLQSDLRAIGPVEAPLNREGILEFYLRGFQEVLGEEGTLTVLTATMSCARYGAPFIREQTPSEVGVFSEYLRRQPGAVRSLHPILSVAGLGPRAEEICGGAHYEGVGWDSPWGRLQRAGAKMMTLGMGDNGGGTTFFHFIETSYGVPYKYVKVMPCAVIASGVEVPGVFSMSVRYHDFDIKNTPVRLKSRLLERGLATQVQTGHAETWTTTCDAAFAVGMEALREDRWFLLENPPRFRAGEIPTDGPSGAMRQRYDRAASAALG
ncbi:MAG TPA: AAC(3) family N-acetyltransferase [Chthoniobacteraceae bacterium]|jgi:aminoglycoside 3-N-acetyltransferase